MNMFPILLLEQEIFVLIDSTRRCNGHIIEFRKTVEKDKINNNPREENTVTILEYLKYLKSITTGCFIFLYIYSYFKQNIKGCSCCN